MSGEDEENETNMFQNAVAFWKAKGQHVEKVNVFMLIYSFKFKKIDYTYLKTHDGTK